MTNRRESIRRHTDERAFDPKEIEDAKRLYLQHGSFPPRQLKVIQQEMHALGWDQFSYFELTGKYPVTGLIEEFGWDRVRLDETIGKRASELKRAGFERWLRTYFSEWNWGAKFQRHIYTRLRKFQSKKGGRLMIFMPPRHGKSEMVTVRYAAWRLAIEPRTRIIIGCHNQRLANRFSRAIRRIDQGAAASSGKERETKAVLNMADEWETPEGGGIKAVGVGSGVTGFGADLIIIDDPVKSRAHAESSNNREKIWDWYSNDLHTRLEPNAGIILIQTRWHEDDLAGRLIKASNEGGEKWDVVSLPALAEPDDPLKRKEGAALCHRRFPKGELEKKQMMIGSYSFASLYQQRPIPFDGSSFRPAHFTKIVANAPPGLSWVRGYDLAVSTRTKADYTASFRCAMDHDGNLYIADGFRARIEYPEQRRYVIERLATEKRTVHCIESALHGQALVQDIQKEVRVAPLRAVKTDSDKITRANLWLPIAEAGKIILVQGPWISAFVDEVCRFPAAANDDQVDAISLAVRMLNRPKRTLHTY